MSCTQRMRRWWICFGMVTCFASYNCFSANPDFAIGSIIRGFELPQQDAEGNLKSKIKGDEALVVSPNEVQIRGLTIELYDQGNVSTTIMAPSCIFWKMENKLTTDEAVTIDKPGMKLTCKGMEWELDHGKGLFRNRVRVQIQPGSYH